MTFRPPAHPRLRLQWMGRLVVALLLWVALLPPVMPARPLSEAEALIASALCSSGGDGAHAPDPAAPAGPAHSASHCAGCPAGLPPFTPLAVLVWALPAPGPMPVPAALRVTVGPTAAAWVRLPARAPPILA